MEQLAMSEVRGQVYRPVRSPVRDTRDDVARASFPLAVVELAADTSVGSPCWQGS